MLAVQKKVIFRIPYKILHALKSINFKSLWNHSLIAPNVYSSWEIHKEKVIERTTHLFYQKTNTFSLGEMPGFGILALSWIVIRMWQELHNKEVASGQSLSAWGAGIQSPIEFTEAEFPDEICRVILYIQTDLPLPGDSIAAWEAPHGEEGVWLVLAGKGFAGLGSFSPILEGALVCWGNVSLIDLLKQLSQRSGTALSSHNPDQSYKLQLKTQHLVQWMWSSLCVASLPASEVRADITHYSKKLMTLMFWWCYIHWAESRKNVFVLAIHLEILSWSL